MKYLKAAVIVALALAVCAPAFAETQTVKVSGNLDLYWLYRSDYDLRRGNDSGAVPAGIAVQPQSSLNSSHHRSDGDDYFMSIAQVEVAADLTDNVSVVIRLLNQRDWNSDAFADSSSGSVQGATDVTTPFTGQDENREDEFDVAVDLAYVQMKEIFYAPLTLTLGRQDIWLGRGLLIGLNYQDPNNSLQADEFTAITSFDAARATLDFAPWTIDSIFAKIDENAHDPEDDRDLWILNVNYQFSQYNAEAEAIGIIDADRATVAPVAGTVTPNGTQDNLTYTAGARAQFDPIPQITLGGEVAWQFGDYFSTAIATARDRSGFLWNVFGEYRWDNQWKPSANIEYLSYSGDGGAATTGDGEYQAWNGLFRGPTYGDIRDYQEVFYETALAADQPASENQSILSFGAALEPMEDLRLDAKAFFFWTEEDILVGTNSVADQIGHELDVHMTYDYTEDVAFGLGLAWFFPGDMYDGGQIGADNSRDGDVDAVATQVMSTVKVSF